MGLPPPPLPLRSLDSASLSQSLQSADSGSPASVPVYFTPLSPHYLVSFDRLELRVLPPPHSKHASLHFELPVDLRFLRPRLLHLPQRTVPPECSQTSVLHLSRPLAHARSLVRSGLLHHRSQSLLKHPPQSQSVEVLGGQARVPELVHALVTPSHLLKGEVLLSALEPSPLRLCEFAEFMEDVLALESDSGLGVASRLHFVLLLFLLLCSIAPQLIQTELLDKSVSQSSYYPHALFFEVESLLVASDPSSHQAQSQVSVQSSFEQLSPYALNIQLPSMSRWCFSLLF